MEAKRAERVRQSTLRHLAMEANETLRRCEELPDHPEAMSPFYALLRGVFSRGPTASDGKKRIGTLCMQVPEELIHAAGGVAFRLCSGAHAFAQVGAEFLPARSCSLVKGAVGMLTVFQDLYRSGLSSVIVPTTCEQKKKAGEMLEELGYTVHTLEVPHSKETEAARLYWAHSVKQLALTLQQATGQRITRRSLQQAIQDLNRARGQYRRLLNLQQSRPSLLYGTDALLVANAYLFDDLAHWTEAVTQLNDALESRRHEGTRVGSRRAPRVLFTGSPPLFPNLKVPLLIEQAGAVVVADDACTASRLLYDGVFYGEDHLEELIPAVADRTLKPCTCPFLTPNTDRKRKLLEMAERFAVNGVIYQAYSGCTLFEMEQRSVAAALEARGLPMLFIETDVSPEDTGQLTTRIEAFVESMKR